MEKEQDPLLPVITNEKLKQTNTVPWLICRLKVVLFVTSCSYFSIWMSGYTLTEWIQDKTKREVFSNGSDTFNLSKCGAVNKSDPVFRDHQLVQQITARWQMYSTMTIKGVSLFTTVVFAVYTDVIGRRFMFILSTFSIFTNFLLTAIQIYFDLGFEFLIIASAIYGLTGTSYGLLSVSFSAVADLTPDIKERSLGIFLNNVGITLSGTFGSLAVGFYIQKYGFFYPAVTAVAIQVVVILVSVLLIEESLPKKDRIKAPAIQTVFLKPFVFYASSDFKGSRLLFCALILAFIFDDMTVVNRKTMETLYQLAEPFCWSSSAIGIYSTVFAVGVTVFGLAALNILQKILSDVSIAMIAELLNSTSFVIEALAMNSLMLYMAAVPGFLNGVSSPIIRGTMSAMTSQNQQGALFASILVVQTIASFMTAFSDNTIYAETLTVFNGLFFFVLAGYCVLAFLFLLLFRVMLGCQQSIVQQEKDESITNEGNHCSTDVSVNAGGKT